MDHESGERRRSRRAGRQEAGRQSIIEGMGGEKEREKSSPGFIVEGGMHEGWGGGGSAHLRALTGRAKMADTSPCTHDLWFCSRWSLG